MTRTSWDNRICRALLEALEEGLFAPEPVLVSIAAALAAKSATSLYDLVKRKFSGREEATTALEAADGTTPNSPEVTALATQLATAEADDPEFKVELRHMWQEISARPAQAWSRTPYPTCSEYSTGLAVESPLVTLACRPHTVPANSPVVRECRGDEAPRRSPPEAGCPGRGVHPRAGWGRA